MDLIALPVPPPDFCRKLRTFDPNLQLNWDPAHGVWAIWVRNGSDVTHVMNVVNEDGSYRPLDERTIMILQRNKYFAEHPKELEKIICDDPILRREKDQAFVHDELRHLAKDRTLKRKFNEAIDMARSVSWNEWTSEKVIKDESGKTIKVFREGRVQDLKYRPHISLLDGSKPTNVEDVT